MATKTTDTVLSSLNANAEALKAGEAGAREQVIFEARSLISSLETPYERLLWMLWAEPTKNLCARLAIDLGLFEKLNEDDGRPKGLAELAESKQADVGLLRRVLRHLAATKIIEEKGTDTYAPTTFSDFLTVPKYRGAIPFLFDTAYPSFNKLPQYLDSAHYKNPTDGTDGPFQYAHNVNFHAFEWVAQRPRIMGEFHNYVTGYQEGRSMWFEQGFFPIKERLADGLDLEGNSGAIVDVGGSHGFVMKGFRESYPDWKGTLIVQDLPQVVSEALKNPDGLIFMDHDFFTPQPVKGARAYYMHNILHDWPDDRCIEILKHLKDAMKPGYSKILIDDMVLPDAGAPWRKTAQDLFMMALAAAQERTESQWRELLGKVGLKVTKIWSKGTDDESLIEVDLEKQ